MWLSTRPGTSAIPRPSTTSVPAPHSARTSASSPTAAIRPSRMATAEADGRPGSRVRMEAPRTARSAGGIRAAQPSRRPLQATPQAGVARDDAEPDGAAAVRAGGVGVAVEVPGVAELGIGLEVGARAPVVLEVHAALRALDADGLGRAHSQAKTTPSPG